MTRASLKFANELLRRLGEELNPSPVNGIVELVKNSYDADATKCAVTIEQPATDLGTHGKLTIEDDGDGMTVADLRDGWLVLGRSRKDNSVVTPLGRHPVGDKGLGRLSALRMGTVVTVKTRPRRNPGIEHELVLNWERFERVSLPNQVPLSITTRQRPRKSKHGTTITVSETKKRLDQGELKRLNRNLLLICNPFVDEKKRFFPTLAIDPVPAVPLPQLGDLFAAAQFKLVARVNKQGRFSGALLDPLGQTLYEADDIALRSRFKGAEATALMPLKFELWIYILQATEFEGGHSELTAVRQWLREFGGVHFFLDGVRVAPYGDPGDDWIGMNAFRSASPELTPATTTSIGFVATDTRGGLKQKTDRSGFIESDTTQAIREFAKCALRWQQSRRIEQRNREEIPAREKSSRDAKDAQASLEEIFKALDKETAQKASRLLLRLTEANRRTEVILRREVELYRTLGTAGIAASVFAHEATQNPLSRIQTNARSVALRVKRHNAGFYDRDVKALLERIGQDVEGLSSVAEVTLSLVRARKRRRQKVSIRSTIKSVIDQFSPFLKARHVEATIDDVGTPTDNIWGTTATLEAALVNLLTNSLQAFDRGGTASPKVRFRMRNTSGRVAIDVDDNGPGIEGIDINDIWLPGETTREDGTGLGLTIVRTAVRDLGGTVTAAPNGELGGASFQLRLPLLANDTVN